MIDPPITIKELRVIQADLALGDVHLVHVRRDGFTMAHTDAERAADVFLGDCLFHHWMSDYGHPPVAPGIYQMVKREHDPTSESFRSDALPYDFTPVEISHE